MILHTGGTIASKVDYVTGAVAARFEREELLDAGDPLLDLGYALLHIAMPDTERVLGLLSLLLDPLLVLLLLLPALCPGEK